MHTRDVLLLTTGSDFFFIFFNLFIFFIVNQDSFALKENPLQNQGNALCELCSASLAVVDVSFYFVWFGLVFTRSQFSMR